jgi:hypothetical protein
MCGILSQFISYLNSYEDFFDVPAVFVERDVLAGWQGVALGGSHLKNPRMGLWLLACSPSIVLFMHPTQGGGGLAISAPE